MFGHQNDKGSAKKGGMKTSGMSGSSSEHTLLSQLNLHEDFDLHNRQALPNAEKQSKYQRYRISRAQAQPVEYILRLYRMDDMAYVPNLYKLFSIKEKAELSSDDVALLKKGYRSMSLLVHPGKSRMSQPTLNLI
jgi:hypothetical protein